MPMHTYRSQRQVQKKLSLHGLQSFFSLKWSRIWIQARRSRLRMTLIVCILVLFCAACGAGSGTTTGSGGPMAGATISPSPVKATATSTAEVQNGYGTSQGCPDDTVVTKTVPAANVTATMQNTTITAQVGNIIEVRLPFGHKWSAPRTVPSALIMQSPAGYASTTTSNCIWRFEAKQKGDIQLQFSAAPLCKPKTMCPMFIMLTSISIKIN